MPATAQGSSVQQLQQIILEHWGYPTLRPFQEQAMKAVLDGRDSLVVLPTGGGKSLCYQAPAVGRGDTTVVVSPLISLMKDQVDARGDAGPEHRHDFLHDRPQANHIPRTHFRKPAESQNLLDEMLGPMAGFGNLRQAGQGVWIGADILPGQSHVAENGAVPR